MGSHGSAREALIDEIYQAGAAPELWPDLLDRIASLHGAVGANLIRQTVAGLRMTSSPAVAEMTEEFDRQGWNTQNSRVGRLLERFPHPGFLTDSDLHTEAELITLPMYTEFLNPRGAAAGAGTIIQGAEDDGIVLAFEGFRDHPASRKAAKRLDALRPHLARAMTLSSQVEEAKARTVLDAFEVMGTAVALLGPNGAVMGANDLFRDAGEGLLRTKARLTPVEPRSEERFGEVFAALARDRRGGSVALHAPGKGSRAVLHLLPCSPGADNPFGTVFAYAVLAKPGNASLPRADLIAALFDLTPAEARVARAVAEGLSPTEIAARLGVSPETVRTQLKRVFSKTSTRRQSELSLLVSGLG